VGKVTDRMIVEIDQHFLVHLLVHVNIERVVLCHQLQVELEGVDNLDDISLFICLYSEVLEEKALVLCYRSIGYDMTSTQSVKFVFF